MKSNHYIKKKIFTAFLKAKYFTSDYAQNRIDMIRFCNERNIIVMRIETKNVKYNPVMSISGNIILDVELRKEEARFYKRVLRKKHTGVLYYVEDNYFTRWIGCRKGIENKVLLNL